MKPSQQSLKDWTKQKWRTKSGKPSTQGSKATGERYLPEKAIAAMSSSEYAATTEKKREDTKKGKQFSKQPKKAANTARQYRNEGGLMSMFGPIEKPEEGLASLFTRMQKAKGGAMHRMPDGSMMEGASHRANYAEGSMLVPPEMEERQQYAAGALVKVLKKLLTSGDESGELMADLKSKYKPNEIRAAKKQIKEEDKIQRAEQKAIREEEKIQQEKYRAEKKAIREEKKIQQEKYRAEKQARSEENKLRNNRGQEVAFKDFKFGQPENTKIKLYRKEVPEGTPEFRREFIKNWRADNPEFEFDGKIYSTEVQRITKAEGGSLFIPPEMEASQEVPEDTYDNIPPEEMEEAMASQLPDGEMVEEYKTYVMTQALEGEEASYLQNALEADPQLRQIFDKVLVTASEFSGAGEVEGPGTGVSDSIPARLSDGEFVMTKKATDQIGAENLQTMMDEAERAYDGGLMSRRKDGTLDSQDSEEEDVKKMMREANRMPSIR